MEIIGPSLLISAPSEVLDGAMYFFAVREVDLPATADLIFSDPEVVTEAGFDFGLLLSLSEMDVKWILSVLGEPWDRLTLNETGLRSGRVTLRAGLSFRQLESC